MALDDSSALSPMHSIDSDHSATELAVATPPVTDARPRPPSAGQTLTHPILMWTPASDEEFFLKSKFQQISSMVYWKSVVPAGMSG